MWYDILMPKRNTMMNESGNCVYMYIFCRALLEALDVFGDFDPSEFGLGPDDDEEEEGEEGESGLVSK